MNTPSDIDLLSIFVETMEAEGVSRKLIHLDIDESFLARLHTKFGTSASLEQIHKLTDRCLANEWLEHGAMAGQYGSLVITATGLGVVRSKQRGEEAKRSRSSLKKLSDMFEDHKGLFVALSVFIALVALLVKLFIG